MTRTHILFPLIAVLGITSNAHADLIASWSGNGTAADSTGVHDGTLENGAGYGPGLGGQAFQFNGVNQYVSVPASTDFAFEGGSFTVGLWANFSAINNGAIGQLPNVFIGDDEGSGNDNKWVFFYENGYLAFHINSPASGPVFLTSTTAITPTLGGWEYFAVTDSGGTYTFYADGVAIGTASTGLSIHAVNAPLTIGQAEGLGYFNGEMQNVQIYNTALSAAQIAQLSSVPEPSSVLLGCLGSVIVTAVALRKVSHAENRSLIN